MSKITVKGYKNKIKEVDVKENSIFFNTSITKTQTIPQRTFSIRLSPGVMRELTKMCKELNKPPSVFVRNLIIAAINEYHSLMTEDDQL